MMERQLNKIIITRRIWQLIGLGVIVLLKTSFEYYPLGFQFGIHLYFRIFLIIFILTYLREERRATKSPDSNLVINWNLVESILLLGSILGYFALAVIWRFDRDLFYACFNTYFLGLVSGVAFGELLYQNTRLKKLDDICKRRYWANYKNSIW